MEYTDHHEELLETDDDDGGWIDTHHYSGRLNVLSSKLRTD